jgi:hypothetical protein
MQVSGLCAARNTSLSWSLQSCVDIIFSPCVIGVTKRTIITWRAEHEEFREATEIGKDIADNRVERSLYERAVGYDFDAVKI